MKYLVKMLIITIVALLLLFWFSLVTIWEFNSYKLQEVWEHYLWSIKYNFRKLKKQNSK